MDAEGLTGIIDAPLDADPIETETEGEPVEVSTDPGDEQPEGEPKPIAPEPPVKDGKLSEAAKATIEEIKAKNPALAAQLKSALYRDAQIAQHFPGGIKEAAALRTQVEEFGGVEAVQERFEQLSYFTDLDQAYTAGDPKFLDAMTATDEGKAAFLQLAPVMLQRFEQMEPMAYSSIVARSIMGDMVANQLPLTLQRLADFIPQDNPKAIEAYNKIQDYLSRLDKLSRTEAPKPKAQGADPLREREQNLTRQEWRGEAERTRSQVFQSEWDRLTAGRKLTGDQQAAIKELYTSRLGRAVRALPGFDEKMQRYFTAGDKNGFIRYLSTVNTAEVPKALKAAFDTIAPGKPGPKAGTSKVVPVVNGKPTEGYTMVAACPAGNTVNYALTSKVMIREGKAVLLDGKRVQWRT